MSPVKLAEALCYYLDSLKKFNLGPTLGGDEQRESLKTAIRSQVVEHCESSRDTTPMCCSSCYVFMKPSEVSAGAPTTARAM